MLRNAWFAAALAIVLGACAHGAPPAPAPVGPDELISGEVTTDPGTPAARSPGVARSELVAVLDQGPGAFLRGVRVKVVQGAHGFAGWEILSFWPDDARFAHVDLAPGDVILKVNGTS